MFRVRALLSVRTRLENSGKSARAFPLSPALVIALIALAPSSLLANNADPCVDGSCRAQKPVDLRFAESLLKRLGANSATANSSARSANTLGSFAGVQNYIGYIDLNPKSAIYRARFKTDAASGVDGRSVSEQLDKTWLDSSSGRLKKSAILAKIAQIEASKKNAFLSFCDQEIQKQNQKGISVNSKAGAKNEGGKPEPLVSSGSCIGLWQHSHQFKDHPILKDWKKEKLLIARDIAIERLRSALALSQSEPYKAKNLRQNPNTRSAQKLFALLFEGLELFDSIKSRSPYPINSLVKLGRSYADLGTKSLVFKKNHLEATNLLKPNAAENESMFYSPEELEALKRSGTDISTLDPPNSGVWRQDGTDIAECDIANYGGLTEPVVGKEMLDRKLPIRMQFKEVPDTAGMTPKITARHGSNEYKVKFSVPTRGPRSTASMAASFRIANVGGMEILSENLANRVAHCLKHTVDPTYHKETIHLTLDEGPKPDESQAAYRARFEKARLKLISDLRRDAASEVESRSLTLFENALSEVRYGEKGQGYLVIKDNSLELRGKFAKGDAMKVGLQAKETGGRINHREVRGGVAMLNAFFSDRDAKAENSDLRIIPNADATVSIGFSLSDMGASMGGKVFGKSNANAFSPNLIKQNAEAAKRGDVATNYSTIFWQPIYENVTIEDARWFTRRLAQMTREQFYEAARSGGATPAETKLYAEKLLHRRDQLVAALFPEATAPGSSGLVVTTDGSRKSVTVPARLSEITDPEIYSPPGFEKYIQRGRLVALDEPHPDGERKIGPTPAEELVKAWKDQLIAMGINAVGGWSQYIPLSGPTIFGGERVKVDPSTGLQTDHKDPSVVPTFACLPARYNVPNPGDSENPWLVVDVYHFGIGARFGEGAGVNAMNMGVNGSAKGGFMKEVVKVRPSKTANYNKNEILSLYKSSCDPGKLEKELDSKMIESMKPGDQLLVNRYFYEGQAASLNSPMVGLPGVGLSAYLQLGRTSQKLDGASFEMTSDRKLVTSYKKEDSAAAGAIGGARLSFLRLPVAGVDFENRDTQQRVYEFDFASINQDTHQAQKNLILSSLSLTDAHLVDQGAQPIQERVRERDARYLMSSRFGFQKSIASRISEKGSFVDRQASIDREYVSELRGKSQLRPLTFSSSDRVFDVTFVNDLKTDEDQIALQVRVNIDKQLARGKDFENFKKGILTLFPPHLAQGNSLESVNSSLGNLKIQGSLTYTHQALDSIFKQNDSDRACRLFEDALPTRYANLSLCALAAESGFHQAQALEKLNRLNAGNASQTLRNELYAVIEFRNGFEKVKSRYSVAPKLGAGESMDRKQTSALASALVELLDRSPLPHAALRTLEKMTAPETYCREAKLSSSDGFVDQEGTLFFKDPSCRKLSSDLLTAKNVAPLRTDRIEEAIQPLLFDFFKTQRITGVRASQRQF
jgi:hypothetical protein